MSARLRLDLRLFRDSQGRDRWDWRLWAGSRIVSGSRQNYSRRIDCARGAEVGAGVCGVVDHLGGGDIHAYRHTHAGGGQQVTVRVLDEREVTR